MRAYSLAVLLCLLVAVPARADVPWRAPRPLPGPVSGQGSTQSTVLITTDILAPGAASRARRARTKVLAIDSAGFPRASATIAGTVRAGPSSSFRASTLVRSRLRPGGRQQLEAVVMRSGASIQATHVLDRHWTGDAVAVAGRSGDVRSDASAVVWLQRSGGGDRLRLVERGPRGGFTPPVTVLQGDSLADAALAVGDDGTLLVAAERTRRDGSRIVARMRPPGGSFEAVDVIGPSLGMSQLSAAVAPDGRAFVAYTTQDAGEEANLPAQIGVASRAPGRRTRFGDRQIVDRVPPADSRVLGVVSVAASAQRAIVAWSATRLDLDRDPVGAVRTAISQTAGRFAAAQDVPGLDGAVGPITQGGTTLAAQSTSATADLAPIRTASLPPVATAFFPAEQASDPSSAGNAFNPQAPLITASGPGLVISWPGHYAVRPGNVPPGALVSPVGVG